MGDHGASEEFGKDVGLVHEVLVTGRKIGVGRNFWSTLAHQDFVFERVKKFVEKENETLDSLQELSCFYKEVFQIKIDLEYLYLQIPERNKDFNLLLVMLHGLPPHKLLATCSKHFGVRNHEDLDSIQSVRPISTYPIWLRNNVEADEDNKNKSASFCELVGVNGITLPERILFELMYYRQTGKHLDTQNATICSGSRSPNHGVPCVHWRDGVMEVYSIDLASSHETLRTRTVVS